jgi:hypothetical protein
MSDQLTANLAALRGELPEPDAAAVGAAYTTLMAHMAARARPRRRPVSRPRSRVAVALAVAVLVVVPAAFAVGSRVLDAFTGTPPTPTVSARYSELNSMSQLADAGAIKHGFAQDAPVVDIDKAHGLVQVETSDGPEQLWTAPADDGSTCLLAEFVNDARSGEIWCDTGHHSSEIAFGWEEGADHPNLLTGIGFVYADADTVTLTLADGSALTAPVVEGAFLVSLAHGSTVTHVAAYDANGNEVATYDPPAPPPNGGP